MHDMRRAELPDKMLDMRVGVGKGSHGLRDALHYRNREDFINTSLLRGRLVRLRRTRRLAERLGEP